MKKCLSVVAGAFVAVMLLCLLVCAISLAMERFTIEGTIESVNYLEGSFGTSPETIVRFSDGRVVPLRGHFPVRIGASIAITTDLNRKVISFKEISTPTTKRERR